MLSHNILFDHVTLQCMHRSVKGSQKKDAARAQKGGAAAAAAAAAAEAEAGAEEGEEDDEEDGLEAYEKGPRRVAKVRLFLCVCVYVCVCVCACVCVCV